MGKRLGKKVMWLTAIALLVGFMSCGAAYCEEKVIKIGTLFPLTGPVALAGQRCKAAVKLQLTS